MSLMEHQMAQKRPTGQYMLSQELPSDLTVQLVQKLQGLRSSVPTDYLKAEVMSKYVSSETDPADVRRSRAIFKWLCTEMENEATNDRLLTTPGEYNILPRVRFDSFMDSIRNIIVGIIGESPPVEALIGSFSGGASTSRPRTQSQPALKYVGKAHVTLEAWEWFRDIVVPEVPGWINAQNALELEFVPGNVLFTVPKKTDIDRCACKEPDLNMFIQKGIGTYFRRCLLRTGINLNDQSINRSLAREGSLTGALATLDLSSASDSVTDGLVASLLPVSWYTLLDAVRCRVTIIDGEEHRNHMFSSMGNGFTFELESMLFYAIARAVAKHTRTRGVISVYGDDIICPTEIAADLAWALQWLGFTVNPDKSFVSGPIRESCGGHYHDGCDITPFYIRKPIETLPDLIDVANKLRKWAGQGYYGVLDPEAEEIWLWLKGFIPQCLWGGDDTTFKYQLASKDAPSHRIVEETKRKDGGTGGYYHWLNATWERTRLWEGVQTSKYSSSLGKYRVKPVRRKDVPRFANLFLHEIG